MENGQLQFIFDEIAKQKMETKDLIRQYKESLASANEYTETVEKIKELQSKKKQIEELTQERLGSAWTKLEDIKFSIESDKVKMTDRAMIDLMDGKTVLVKDQYENEYEPVWSVRFRKIK